MRNTVASRGMWFLVAIATGCVDAPVVQPAVDVSHVGQYALREVGHVPMPAPIETLVNYRRTRDALSGHLVLGADGTYTLAVAWRWRDEQTGQVLESGVHNYNGTYTRRADSLFFHTPHNPNEYSPPFQARLIGAMLHGTAYGIIAEYERVSTNTTSR